MKDLGKEMEAKFGPGSDFAKKIAEDVNKKVDADMKRAENRKDLGNARSAIETARGKTRPANEAATARDRRRERRIAALEAQIAKLAEELKALRDDDKD